ncbi:unnamed protein product [Caenorhabditis sp. 36 PRJEB53466]|nr:unnamed protein product [Caenorhabditis sp. 36 PRJEB53466]
MEQYLKYVSPMRPVSAHRGHPPRNRRSRKCAGCCSKCQLFVSYLLVIVGILFLALASWLFFFRGDLVPLIHSHFYVNCVHLAVACGFFNIIIGFLVHSAVNNRCALVFYLLILIFSVILEGCLVYFTFSYHATYIQELEVSLPNDILNNYGHDDQITAAVNFMQRDGKCCGSNAFNDWPKPEVEDHYLPYVKTVHQRIQYVPDSCCKGTHQRKGCALSDSPNNIFYKGCLPFLKEEVYNNLNFLFTVAGASLLLHIFNLFFGCCACFKNDDDEEDDPFKDYDQEMHLFD